MNFICNFKNLDILTVFLKNYYLLILCVPQSHHSYPGSLFISLSDDSNESLLVHPTHTVLHSVVFFSLTARLRL